MARPKKEKVEQEVEIIDQIDEILNDKSSKGKHYGGVSGSEIVLQPSVSTGSLMFDYALSQGMPSGSRGFKAGSITRATGPRQTGKTSLGIEMGKQWQLKMPNPKVVIFNAEGRITIEILKRLGINLDKPVFRMINSNNGEFIFSTQEQLIRDNPEGYNYFFLTDSSDALNRQSDLDKGLDEAQKIAGGALLASVACKRLSLPVQMGNHHMYITGQHRANMAPSPMGGMAPRNTTSGGKALEYYPSLIIDFKKPWTDTYIFSDPADKKSKRLGNNVEMLVEKSYNEINGMLVRYPVKYGSSVWKSLELMNLCTAWNLLSMEGRTYKFHESFRSDVHDKGFDLPEKIVGQKDLINFFDTNLDFVKIGEDIFETLLFGAGEKKFEVPVEEQNDEV